MLTWCTFSDYHLRFSRVGNWMFYGGDVGLSSSSMTGIFLDYFRDTDSGTDGVNIFGSRLSKN